MKTMTFKCDFLRETIRRKAITFLAIGALATMLAMVSSCDKDSMDASNDLLLCLTYPEACLPEE